MGQKLKSALRNPLLRSAVKAVIFAGGLYWAGESGGFLPVFLFAAAASYLHFRQIHKPRFAASLMVLLVVSLVGVFEFSDSSVFRLAPPVFFGFLFFLLLGVKDLGFPNRPLVYRLFVNLLLLAVFGLYFLSPPAEGFWEKHLAAGTAVFLISKEMLSFLAPIFPRRHLLAAAVLTVAILEILWSAGLLPVGFVSSVAFSVLAFFAASDLAIRHFSGALSRAIVIRRLAAFLILTAVIFAASR